MYNYPAYCCNADASSTVVLQGLQLHDADAKKTAGKKQILKALMVITRRGRSPLVPLPLSVSLRDDGRGESYRLRERAGEPTQGPSDGLQAPCAR
jgi:hypothetical protein